MTHDELVEKVANAIAEMGCPAELFAQCESHHGGCACREQARAAIVVALEEAAGYCEMKAKHYWGDGRDCCDAALQQTAAAIRALVKEPKL